MFLKHKTSKVREASIGIILLMGIACSTPKPTPVLTISEQIEADTETVQSLQTEYRKKVAFVSFPEGSVYLRNLARKIAKVQAGFAFQTVNILIHRDDQKELTRFFSFPGTTISIPLSFIKAVEFENELAAVIALELAHVMNRHLAKKMNPEVPPVLFGVGGLFDWDKTEKTDSIQMGMRLLYYSGYDLRGMASIFQQYPQYFVNPGLDSSKKEVEFNGREAQRALSEYLPSFQPIVRSSDFILMKKGLKRL